MGTNKTPQTPHYSDAPGHWSPTGEERKHCWLRTEHEQRKKKRNKMNNEELQFVSEFESNHKQVKTHLQRLSNVFFSWTQTAGWHKGGRKQVTLPVRALPRSVAEEPHPADTSLNNSCCRTHKLRPTNWDNRRVWGPNGPQVALF